VIQPSNEHSQSSADTSPAALSARIVQLMGGAWIAQVTRAAAHFKLADVLGRIPISADELAHRVGLEPDLAHRLLRGCVLAGLASFEAGYVATPLLGALKDAPGSMRSYALALGAPALWLPWSRFIDALGTGECQAVPALGTDLWSYYAKAPAEAAEFTDAMTGMTSMVASEAVQTIEFSRVRSVADIGGAAGALLFAVMAAHPHVHGILFDQPQVVAAAAPPAAFLERFTAVGGDFLDSVPAAELYLIKHILHDWDDAACVRILQSVARAMPAHGRVVVVEMLLGDEREPGFTALMDLAMLVLLGARERTAAHYGELFSAAGLKLSRVTPLRSGYAILEATRAA
jgi:hypothetical protein